MKKVTVVPVYDLDCNVVNQLEIEDEIVFTGGRVCKGKEFYYKGIGVPYSRHHVMKLEEIDNTEYDILGHTGIFYSGYAVSKKKFQGKYGIFQVKYQPFFTDFVGGCGVKEGMIVLNSETFKRASVEVIDAITYDEENKHTYYIMKYKDDRKGYTEDGSPKNLTDLLDFMLQNKWNFLWDKAAINDISSNGLISDVADLFVSDKLEHQLGTVYSVLYSLEKMNQEKYHEFLHFNGLSHTDQSSFIFNSVKLLEKNKVNTEVFYEHDDWIKNYKNIVLNYLLTGKNCAYCSCDMYTEEGNRVRDHYIQTVSNQMQSM